ncbi:MAG: hypothetical protein WAW70_05950 [Streptococcus parauberis]|uniref:hypothetical protein n=1 Tax=Streptococcus TaxID=1301 RepID=UPI0009762287|nr:MULTISPECIES: hypothetical protein [Streptococcus]MSU87461.1 hypothetical protein [Streptococcus dysgalactiae subsp. dysgalactiae]ONH62983.1 hypothetical protein ASN87_01722 [Streptococcus parauberis]PCH14547.1 hypothetical protein A9Y58_00046 [Streptococcus parauberis]QGG97229.1 hypothetical protein EA459_00305 [Streptococcus dysgalactiae subsp. dysgalactiae]
MKEIEEVLLSQVTYLSKSSELIVDTNKLSFSRKAMIAEVESDYQWLKESDSDLADSYLKTSEYLSSLTDETYQLLVDKLVRYGTIVEE